MQATATRAYLKRVIANLPADWLNLTTHRLDIYDEPLAKTQFLQQFEALFEAGNADRAALEALPTAFDYIRLGHPLSSVLEWAVARAHGLEPDRVISFASRTAPIMSVLRTNLLEGRDTVVAHTGALSSGFDADTLRRVYGFRFETVHVESAAAIPAHDGSTVFVEASADLGGAEPGPVDFSVRLHPSWGSLVLVHGEQNAGFVPKIQHTRRRETIAMTPANCRRALSAFVGEPAAPAVREAAAHERGVRDAVRAVTGCDAPAILGSSGLSVQYAVVMGLVDHALEHHPGKPIRIVVPPNCYGGTNDQARRVAATRDDIAIVDLPVDGGQDMVRSTDVVLEQIAAEDGVPFIIAEIPTNPRVEVPDLEALRDALSRDRFTPDGAKAIEPVFILDQTFCPNVRFLGDDDVLASVRTVAYVSGSKFPSGGKCTAGYGVANARAADLLPTMQKHLSLCDNEATDGQLEVLAAQLPSMLARIEAAYANTRAFVGFVRDALPEAKLNFVSEALASLGFTPSVFSLDLPATGDSPEAREANKRAANLDLIRRMITEIPESKFCVSYGQLKGCYWTVPATSTQGTTQEGDKDYIVRVSVSPELDLERHERVFRDFVREATTLR